MEIDSVTEFIREQTADRVCDGPFVGMKLSFNVPWQQWDKPSKLLGTYEQETHEFIYAKSGPEYDCVIDVGCSEGYLAVGLALVNPRAHVLAYDTNKVAQGICAENADLNGVGDRITYGDFCDADELRKQAAEYKKVFVVCDCEGYERELFSSPETCWAVRRADLLIECHDFIHPHITAELEKKLSVTHNVKVVSVGGRNPNKQLFMEVLSDIDRWRAVCEFRPRAMSWLLCEPK